MVSYFMEIPKRKKRVNIVRYRFIVSLIRNTTKHQKQSREVFYKICSTLLNKRLQHRCFQIIKDSYFEEHLRAAASDAWQRLFLEEVAPAFPFFSVIFLPDYPWFSNTKITLSPWRRVIISFLSMLELHAKKVATTTRLPMYKTTDAWELEFYWSICVVGNYPLTKKNLLINAKVLKNDTNILELQKICDNKIKYKV